LSSQAKSKINKNRNLKNIGLLDSVISVDFVDKLDLKDLKKLLNNYLISVDLQTEQRSINSKDGKQVKKKVKRNLVKFLSIIRPPQFYLSRSKDLNQINYIRSFDLCQYF
jgi:hypothetical protein